MLGLDAISEKTEQYSQDKYPAGRFVSIGIRARSALYLLKGKAC
jgi:hypothetical protein